MIGEIEGRLAPLSNSKQGQPNGHAEELYPGRFPSMIDFPFLCFASSL